MTRISSEMADRRVGTLLVAAAAVLMILMPGMTTFDEALTQGALHLGIATPLQDLAPIVAAQAAGILQLTGIRAGSSGSYLTVWNAAGGEVPLFLSWNCLGWQAMILLGLSLWTGLARPLPLESRVQVILAGLAGTYLVNLLRILVVLALAARAGYLPAILFHDYAGTLMTLGWLFAFWYGVQRWVLPEGDAHVTAG